LRHHFWTLVDHLVPGCEGMAASISWAMQLVVRTIRTWLRPVPIQVLVKDRSQRRTIERDVRAGLRRLRRALGEAFPSDAVVVVQQVICTDRQLAGCYQLARHPDGAGFALIRLALQVDGRQIPMDEVLSVLAEQCIGLAVQQAGGVGLLVPIELRSIGRSDGGRVDAIRPDPLAPNPASGTSDGGQMRRVS
jgi:hypothetical protein